VLFVGPDSHIYLSGVEAREEAGTPPIIGALRCGLAFGLRSTVGAALIQQLTSAAVHAFIASLRSNPNIVLLGSSCPAYHAPDRLPIVSFLVRVPLPQSGQQQQQDGQQLLAQGGWLHHGFVCKLLNDVYGIQARSGCSCAGPYGHVLLGVSEQTSQLQSQLAAEGEACVKGGWARVSFSLSTQPDEVEYVAAAVHQVGVGLAPLGAAVHPAAAMHT
jgi:selenocysteine lyase/cysteine desulfurase